MTTFALVHGAGHGGWCWDRVASLLRQSGHTVVAPDLPAGDNGAGAARYAEVTVAALRDSGDDVIVVGHSLGGLTIPLVAARRAVRHLVYLCALLPRPGHLPFEEGADPDAPPSVAPGLHVETDADGRFRFPADVARSHLYNRCTEADAAWAIARLRAQSRAPHREVCPLPALPRIPSTYVAGADDRTVLPAYGAHLARTRLGIAAVTIDADHSPFLSAPRQLADLLLAL